MAAPSNDTQLVPEMKKLILCALVSVAVAGCAGLESSNAPSSTAGASKAAKEDFVTGSRIPRSDSAENYQGAKSMTGKDYQDFKASTSLKGGN